MSKKRMSNADAAWLHMDRPTNLMVVNSVMWTAEPVDRERVRAVIQERLVDRFPRFSQRIAEPFLGIGVPSWEDDPNFDLDLHIHEVALPAPGGQAELEALAADLMVRPLDGTKPLWEMTLVEGYQGGTAVISRMHHCIADGIALARVLLSLTDDAPGDGAFLPASDGHHGPLDAITGPVRTVEHAAEAVLREGEKAVAHPQTELGSAVAGGKALGKLLFTTPEQRSALHAPLGVQRRVTWSRRIPLERIKVAGHRTGTTVNDVVLAAVTGAMRDHFDRCGTPVDEMRAMVPYNLRPLDKPLPRDLGNRFGLVYLTLPVGVADREERLREVHARMAQIKHTPEGAVSYGILGLIGLTPAPVEKLAVDLFASRASAVMTNVPGPRRPVYFAGAKVDGVIAWVPAGGGIGLGVSIFSYAGGLTVGLSADPRLMPDPHRVIAVFERELHELAPPRRRSSKRRAVTTP